MIRRFLNFAIIICAFISVCTISNAQTTFTTHVPAGVEIEAVLSSEINSQNAIVGQIINVVLVEDFTYENQLIASNGSILQGSVVSYKKADGKNKEAQVQIRFTTIRTPYNNLIPISAIIKTEDNSGILSGANILIEPNSKLTVYFDQPTTLGAQ